MMNLLFYTLLLYLLSSFSGFADAISIFHPISCMKLTSTHNQYTHSITFVNNCKNAIDLKNKTLQFHMDNPPENGRDFWGDFSTLSYPIRPRITTSKDLDAGDYIVEIMFIYPDAKWVNSKLNPGDKIVVTFLSSGGTITHLILF